LSGQLAKIDHGLSLPDIDAENKEKLLSIKAKLEADFKVWRSAAEQKGILLNSPAPGPPSHRGSIPSLPSHHITNGNLFQQSNNIPPSPTHLFGW
jgi:hypothetical protein